MVKSEEDFSERRRYKRLDKTVITWFKPAEKKDTDVGFDETFGRITKNIAERGVLFESDEPVPLSTLLNLEIKLPSIQRVIRTQGRVVRVEKIGNNRYDLGVYFIDIHPDDQKNLLEFIREQGS